MAQSKEEEETRIRILTHMNTSHASSLGNYLQHYSRLPRRFTTSPRLEDITLDHMTVSCSSGWYTIPISPPMTSLSETRERTVAMEKESLAGLGKSDLTVQEYRFPGTSAVGMGVLTIWAVNLLSQAKNLQPTGSWFYEHILSPYAPSWFIYLVQYLRIPILAFIFVMHTGETIHLAGWKLRKFNVEVGTGVWWKWILTCLWCGFPAHESFDREVGRLEELKEKKSSH